MKLICVSFEHDLATIGKVSMLLHMPRCLCKVCFSLTKDESDYENFPDDKLLKTFSTMSDHSSVSKLMISGIRLQDKTGLAEVQSFIFSARKYFPPDDRPELVLMTTESLNDISDLKMYSGLYYELIQYGNIAVGSGSKIYKYIGPNYL